MVVGALLGMIERFYNWLRPLWRLRVLAALWTALCSAASLNLIFGQPIFSTGFTIAAVSGAVSGALVLPRFLNQAAGKPLNQVGVVAFGGLVTTLSVAMLFAILIITNRFMSDGTYWIGLMTGALISPLSVFFGLLFGTLLTPIGIVAALIFAGGLRILRNIRR